MNVIIIDIHTFLHVIFYIYFYTAFLFKVASPWTEAGGQKFNLCELKNQIYVYVQTVEKKPPKRAVDLLQHRIHIFLPKLPPCSRKHISKI